MTAEAREPRRARLAARIKPLMSISVGAFIMSATVSLTNVYYALNGPEIFLFEPETVLLYRHGEGAQSALVAAVRVAMVNLAADDGDVMIDAALMPAANAPEFPVEGSVTPSFNTAAEPLPCADSCVASHRNLLVKAVDDEILDIEGGGTRLRWLTFPISCAGAKGCAFRDFGSAVAALQGRPLDLRIKVRFREDGERLLECRSAAAVDGAYLEAVGWTTLTCARARVSGEPLL